MYALSTIDTEWNRFFHMVHSKGFK